jgi:hypothetical protein
LPSFTVTTTVKLPGAAGVPESVPLADIVSVDGCPVAVKLYGWAPPVAEKLAEYGDPTVPFGADAVEITSAGGAILMV